MTAMLRETEAVECPYTLQQLLVLLRRVFVHDGVERVVIEPEGAIEVTWEHGMDEKLLEDEISFEQVFEAVEMRQLELLPEELTDSGILERLSMACTEMQSEGYYPVIILAHSGKELATHIGMSRLPRAITSGRKRFLGFEVVVDPELISPGSHALLGSDVLYPTYAEIKYGIIFTSS